MTMLLPTLVLIMMVTALVSSLGAPLVPLIAMRLGVSLESAQWTLTAPILVAAVATPLCGRIGADRYRRRVLIGGLVVVAVGLVIAAMTEDIVLIIVGRALQGVGLALAPLAISAARDLLPPERVPGSISLLSVSAVSGAGLGYPVTALVVGSFGLAAAYWVGLVAVVGALGLIVLTVPRSLDAVGEKESIDAIGAIALATGSVGTLLVIGQGHVWGWGSPAVGAIATGAVTSLVWWVKRSLRVNNSLVDLSVVGSRKMLAPNVCVVLAGAGSYLVVSLVMVMSQADAGGYGLGLSVVTAGLLLVPYALLSVSASRVALLLEHRFDSRQVMTLGTVVYVLAASIFALAHTEVWQLVLVMSIGGLGSGLIFSCVPRIVVAAVDRENTSSALAFNQLLRYIGFAMGSASCPVLLGLFTDNGPDWSDAITWSAASAAVVFMIAAVINTITARFTPARPTRTKSVQGRAARISVP